MGSAPMRSPCARQGWPSSSRRWRSVACREPRRRRCSRVTLDTGESPRDVIEREGLAQVSDVAALGAEIEAVHGRVPRTGRGAASRKVSAERLPGRPGHEADGWTRRCPRRRARSCCAASRATAPDQRPMRRLRRAPRPVRGSSSCTRRHSSSCPTTISTARAGTGLRRCRARCPSTAKRRASARAPQRQAS